MNVGGGRKWENFRFEQNGTESKNGWSIDLICEGAPHVAKWSHLALGSPSKNEKIH